MIGDPVLLDFIPNRYEEPEVPKPQLTLVQPFTLLTSLRTRSPKSRPQQTEVIKELSPPRGPGKFGFETPIQLFSRLAIPKVYMEPPPFIISGPILYKRRPMKILLPRERKIYPKRTVDRDKLAN